MENSGIEITKKSEKYDVQLKIIIIGDSSVGKSCILNYYLKNTCKHPQIPFEFFLFLSNIL